MVWRNVPLYHLLKCLLPLCHALFVEKVLMVGALITWAIYTQGQPLLWSSLIITGVVPGYKYPRWLRLQLSLKRSRDRFLVLNEWSPIGGCSGFEREYKNSLFKTRNIWYRGTVSARWVNGSWWTFLYILIFKLGTCTKSVRKKKC